MTLNALQELLSLLKISQSRQVSSIVRVLPTVKILHDFVMEHKCDVLHHMK